MCKDITINDKPARLMDKVHTGDDVFVPTMDEKSNYVPSYRYAQIKYEDDDMAIVMKPKGVKTHPNVELKRKQYFNESCDLHSGIGLCRTNSSTGPGNSRIINCR